MKQTSIKKLSEIYNALKGFTELDNNKAADLIQEVIRAESQKVKGSKFDIFSFTGNEKFRVVLNGVFHDEGNKVACDSHILVAIKADYPAEYEGQILNKDGSFVDQQGMHYPEWRRVLPNFDKQDFTGYEVDEQKFYDWIEVKRAQYKSETGKSTKFDYSWQVQVGPARLKAEKFDQFLIAMKELGATQILVQDARRCIAAKSDKGIVILMPIMRGSETDNVVTLA